MPRRSPRTQDSEGALDRGRPTTPWYARLRRALLRWYDEQMRELPWRVRGGPHPDAYRVWLSEIMLQQTTTATVAPYYARFLERWPDIRALAAAPLDDVLHAWQGLGYYSRARNLHRCAQAIVSERGGRFPATAAELATLPGVGPYTSAAIASIAFGEPAVALDGNVERVAARLFAVEAPLPGAKPTLTALIEGFAGAERSGDLVQALMDLGATVCTPRRPACLICPWRADCRAYAEGDPARLPVRTKGKARPHRRAVAFVIVRPDGALLLRRRPDRGLLGGLMEVPSSPWDDSTPTRETMLATAPIAATWQALPGTVAHGFTHFELDFEVVTTRLSAKKAASLEGVWCAPETLGEQALSTLMKKVLRHAAQHGAIAVSV